jgi:hypothetical protein
MGRRESALALVGFLAAAFLCLALPLAAQAERRASRGESQRMWDTVFAKYGFDGCVQHRGEISTAHTRRKYGIVTVSDSHCGNGQFVLSTRRHAAHARWRVLGAGSDWGAPERCAEDLRRIPRSALEDFFSPEICRGRAGARPRVPANASAGVEAGALIQPDGGALPTSASRGASTGSPMESQEPPRCFTGAGGDAASQSGSAQPASASP